MRIGLLGGSFNPAHEGHLHISREALKRLRLHQVWWIVSPQNPLKSPAGMGHFQDRLAGAARLARDYRIRVSDIEAGIGSCYSVDTLARIRRRWRHCRFVWLMGADNLGQISRWHHWRRIFGLMPLAVFARSPYDSGALTGMAARVFRSARRPVSYAPRLTCRTPPAWIFIRGRRHPASATRIRAALVMSGSVAGPAHGTGLA